MVSILKQVFPPDLSAIYDEKLANQLANTQGAIGSLNQLARLLHNPTLLMRPILAKEAESSSQLEGTQASIEDAYKIDIEEQTPEKRNEAIEIRNYEEAMLTGLEVIKKTSFNSLAIREVQKRLLQGVRGHGRHPGEYRKGDVWIGDIGTLKEEARYVAPDAVHVPALMEELETFIQNRGTMNPLITCGVIHHRFEAIHPFEDGNGRTGRLLISLYLINQGMLTLPILYPSGYFERYRENYINALSRVDTKEDWYSWLLFFLKGLETQAQVSLETGLEIDSLFKSSRAAIEKERAGLNLIRVLEYSFTHPFLTAPILHKDTGIPLASCTRYLKTLASKGVIDSMGIHKKQRVYANRKLLNILRRI